MIALVDELPLVEFENGHVFAFRPEWLRQHLVKAAARAGYRDWWLADHVARSVTNYLITHYESTVLSASELRHSVSEVLATIGYSEVAEHFAPTRPPRDISLMELAAASGTHELTFFALLREALTKEMQDDMTNICLTYLHAAVKHLVGVKLFTEECVALQDEIVSFSRSFIASRKTANILIR
ncbi:MAG TPA: hypothetical protein VF585_11695 [Chthoniobacterales bacterium]|jgi:hypothetical protein